jgi:serine/threonine protein kinase
VIEGVYYLHTNDPVIVHGDLKPVSLHQLTFAFINRPQGNILIDECGIPKICDFGLARIFLEAGATGLTTTSEHGGTQRYLAYELVVSDEVRLPTAASDVHALGCVGLEVY